MHEAAECETERHACDDEQEYQHEHVAKHSPLRHTEHHRHQKQPVYGYPDVNQGICSSPSDQGTVVRRPAFPHGAVHHADAVEHGLLHHENQGCGEEEYQEGHIGVERYLLLDRDGVDHLLYALVRHTLGGIAGRFDLSHLIEHHVIDGHSQVLVVKEAGHVGVGGYCRLLQTCQAVAVVLREEDHAVHLALLHQFFGLLHGGALVGYLHLAGSVHLAHETSAVLALAEIDHGHRHVVNRALAVHEPVHQRVYQSAEQEDDRHIRVGEYSFEFFDHIA